MAPARAEQKAATGVEGSHYSPGRGAAVGKRALGRRVSFQVTIGQHVHAT